MSVVERIIDQISADRLTSFQRLKNQGKFISEEQHENYDWAGIAAENVNHRIIRLLAIRVMGGVTFCNVLQDCNHLQYVFDSEKTEDYPLLNLLNSGDIVRVSISKDILFQNKRGVNIPLVREWQLVSKCFVEPPNRRQGIKNPELYYKKRYLSLMINPLEQKLFQNICRANLALRNLLMKHNFMEVEAPILEPEYGGALAQPFITKLNHSNRDLYLSISPELALKKYIIAGFNRVYSMARCFRNESIGTRHHPEFSMLEVYCTDANVHDMAVLTQQLIHTIFKTWNDSTKLMVEFNGVSTTIDWEKPFRKMSYKQTVDELVLNPLGISYDTADLNTIRLKLKEPSWMRELENKDNLLTGLFENYAEVLLQSPTHIFDHPLNSTPLCSMNSRGYLDRIETYILGVEVANLYTQRTDFLKLEQAFYSLSRTKAGADEVHTYNKSFLQAMACGMPASGGLGIGLTRLYAMASGSASIKDVIFSPLSNL